jgi:glycosyltransferase involved in cell wall biosynthesis
VNVGFVTHYYDRAEGTGGYAVEMVTRLAAAHDVTLYAAGVRTPPPPGVTVVTVPAITLRAYTTIVTFPRAFARVQRPHDVLHAQGWVARKPNVVTAHIVLAAWREAARAHAVPAPLGERLLGGFVARREAALLARAPAVIAPSRRAGEDIRRLTGRADGITVIPHGCDRALTPTPRPAARRACGVDDRAFLAAYIGDARKGLRIAVAALKRAEDAHLLVLSGSDPAPFRDLASQLGVTARLHWAPPSAGAAEAFGAADVVLQPTIYDTFGMVIGEALALGVPVIASAQAGAAELIEHRRSGWILGGVTTEESGAALMALAQDAELRARLAHEGRKVAARYTWDETVRRTVDVYQRARPA